VSGKSQFAFGPNQALVKSMQ